MASKLKDTKIQVVIPAGPKSAAKSTGSVKIEGNAAYLFSQTVGKIKSLEAEKVDLEVKLKAAGVAELLKTNCAAEVPHSSVKLIDEEDGVVTVTLKNAYSETTPTAAEKVCEELVLDPNDYFQTVLKYSFNQKIFYKADGTFNEKVYRALRRVIGEKVAELIDSGDLDPAVDAFSETKAVVVKPEFHAKRWALGVEANETIQKTVPAQVAIKVG